LDAIYILLFKVFGKRISFAAIGMLLLYLITNSRFITLYTTVIWWVGDGMAALAGSAYETKKWPWSAHKTILGSAAFFICSILAALPLAMINPDIPLPVLFIFIFIPCLWASMIEALPFTFIKDRKADDNLLIILSTGILVYGLAVLFQSYIRL
jgi:dolichol kinase